MKRAVLLLLSLSLLLCACGAPAAAAPRELTVFAMDTVMNLRVYGDEAALREAQALIREIEGRLSVTDCGSEIAAVNRNGGGSVSPETAALLRRALAICADTNGALDVSVYPALRAWGFTLGEDAYTVPDAAALSALREKVDYRKIGLSDAAVTLAPGMEIDLGSVAKGYTGDCVAAALRASGVDSALLDLGGNVQALGAKPDGAPWRVAVRDPAGEGYLGILDITDGAVVTSGGYERFFVRSGVTYWHILDPATLCPARSGLVSATVVGEEGLLCDALSTALFVMGADAAADYWRARDGFGFILLGEDGTLYLTEDLAGRFTPAGAYAAARPVIVRKG